jgi:hypothetical protein
MATIFFSWQADTDRKTGKNLVHRALEAALVQLHSEADVEDADRSEASADEKHEVDMDTKGVPGSPSIVDTIFAKIDVAAVFVADLTFVANRLDGRPMPNPNVLIEYGWALKSRSDARVIALMNTAYGEPTEKSMPFDIRHKRFPITYHCPEGADEPTRQAARTGLAKELKAALAPVLKLPMSGDVEPEFVPETPAQGRSRFRKSGTMIGTRVNTGEEVYFSSGPATWLRLMPSKPLPSRIKIADLLSALWESRTIQRPSIPNMQGESQLGVRGPDGFGYYVQGYGADVVDDDDDGDGDAQAVMFALQSGEVWSMETHTLSSNAKLVVLDEREFARGLVEEAKMLKALGVNGPYKWIAGMEGLTGRRLVVNRREVYHARSHIDVVEAAGTFSGNEDEAKAALEPFFAEIFDAFGMHRPSTPTVG